MSSPIPPVPPNDQGGVPDAMWSAVPDAGDTAYLPQTHPQAYPPQPYDTDGYQAPYDAQSYPPEAYPPQPYQPPTVDQNGYGIAGYADPGYPAPNGYPGGPYAAPVDASASPQGVNGLAIASLIAAFLFPPLGIIFGHLALSQIESRREGGRGLAVAGLVLSYLFTVLIIITVILMVVFLVVLAKAFDDYRLRSLDVQPRVVSQTVSSATSSTQIAITVPATAIGDMPGRPVWAGAVVRFAGQ